jgi:hypothetical protein
MYGVADAQGGRLRTGEPTRKPDAEHGREAFRAGDHLRDGGENMDETKVEYMRKQQAELKELEARLDLLESKADMADAEAKIGFGEQVYELKEKCDNLRDDIEDLKKADDDTWKDLRNKIEEATIDFRTALDVAATRFK